MLNGREGGRLDGGVMEVDTYLVMPCLPGNDIGIEEVGMEDGAEFCCENMRLCDVLCFESGMDISNLR